MTSHFCFLNQEQIIFLFRTEGTGQRPYSSSFLFYFFIVDEGTVSRELFLPFSCFFFISLSSFLTIFCVFLNEGCFSIKKKKKKGYMKLLSPLTTRVELLVIMVVFDMELLSPF